MDLNDFGTESNHSKSSDGQRIPPPAFYAPEEANNRPIQWKVVQSGVYESCGTTARQLPASAFSCVLNQYGETQFLSRDLQVDDLIDFADSLPAQILQEIEDFWSLGDKFRQYGYLHRRGYLLYGPQGSGKSSVVHQVVHRIVKAGHIAVFCEHPGILTRAMELFRKIEHERPLVCLFEDIDAIIEMHGDSELLQWLDGSHQINKVINIATTNYPERLDRRIVSRPRRFDRIIKIESPTPRIREAYLRRKLPELIERAELTRWVELTEGLSFAAMAELVISVACLGNKLEDTIRLLRMLDDQHPSSKEFDHPGAMGFGAVRPREQDDKQEFVVMKLIIGCGYLGLRLARLWREQGHHVVATKRTGGPSADLAQLGVDVIACDVLDPASLTQLPRADTVAYAIALDRSSGQSMRPLYVHGLWNVLRKLPKPDRFIYVSSSGVYGQADGEWVNEESPTEPREESGRIVLEAEADLRAMAPYANILRFAGIYGPGRLLRQKAIAAGEPIIADADRWLNLIHVEDGARAVLAADALAPPGRVFNVCDGRPVLRRDFYGELAKALHAPPPRFQPPPADAPMPPHEQANRRISNARLLRELKFTFLFPSYLEGLGQAAVGKMEEG